MLQAKNNKLCGKRSSTTKMWGVEVESDALEMVKIINKDVEDFCTVSNIIGDVKGLDSSFDDCSFIFYSRSRNTVACYIACKTCILLTFFFFLFFHQERPSSLEVEPCFGPLIFFVLERVLPFIWRCLLLVGVSMHFFKG